MKWRVEVVFLAALLCTGACVNEGKIDTTNQTLAKSLEELKTLNKNMLVASDRLSKDLGTPVKEMADGFTRVADAFAANMDATQNILKLVQSIRPEEFELVHAQFLQASDAFAAFTKRLAEEGIDLETLGAQSASVLTVLGSLAPLVAQVSSPHRKEAEASVEDVGAAGARLGEATGDAAEKGEAVLGSLRDQLVEVSPPGSEIRERVERFLGDVHQLARMAPSMQALLDNPEFEGLVGQIPNLMKLQKEGAKALADLKTDRESFTEALALFLADRADLRSWVEEVRRNWKASRGAGWLGFDIPPLPHERIPSKRKG